MILVLFDIAASDSVKQILLLLNPILIELIYFHVLFQTVNIDYSNNILIHFCKRSMDFETSKSRFMELYQLISNDVDKSQFLHWLKEDVVPELDSKSSRNSITDIKIEKIAADIRKKLPLDALMKTENIVYPTIGEDSNLTPANTVHIDAFLYDEQAEDALVEEGLLSKSYCIDCGSKNIDDVTFITHSCSKERLQFMFGELLPSLKDKTVIDIGSRIGAVLYGAYFYSEANKIIGIEINTEFCHLQRCIVDKYKLGDKISILEGDMASMAEVIATGDVVILNNVFEWFMAPEMQVSMWKFLRSTFSPGTLLVTIPSLETSLEPLDTGICLETWVKPMQTFRGLRSCTEDQVEESDVCLYQILEPESV